MPLRIYVGITDNNWFYFLKDQKPDEVNFWIPSVSQAFRALDPGEPFLFKLHAPDHYIVGGGWFVRYVRLPISLAWAIFGLRNGVPSEDEFREAIVCYRQTADWDPEIGCVILADPFFFEQEDWIGVPPDWGHGIQRGKTYPTDEEYGRHLWQEVQQRLVKYSPKSRLLVTPKNREQERVTPGLAPMLGPSAFEALVLTAYQLTCAITGVSVPLVLRPTHIKPVSDSGPNDVSNGLLLRADIQLLFSKGYLTVDPGFRVHVSRHMKQRYTENNPYAALDGRVVAVLPREAAWRPAREHLEWHNEKVFLG